MEELSWYIMTDPLNNAETSLTLNGSSHALSAPTPQWPDEKTHFAQLDSQTHTHVQKAA